MRAKALIARPIRKSGASAWRCLVALTLTVLLIVHQASAIFGSFNPLKIVGDAVGAVAGPLIGGPLGSIVSTATAPVISQAEAAGQRLINDVDKKLSVHLKTIDASLEARITQLNDTAAKADEMLAKRAAQFGDIVTEAVANVDAVIEKNLRELDSLAERRLGNVDTIATKASLTFEEVFLRSVSIILLMVFGAATIWRLCLIIGSHWPNADAKNWWSRFWQALSGGFGRVAGEGLVALVAVAILVAVYKNIPNGPRDKAKLLVSLHEKGYHSSIERVDLQNSLFHLSQLRMLDPTAANYRLWTLKAELLRDVFTRPALLQQTEGLAKIQGKLAQIDEANNDPDLLALKGWMLWRRATTKTGEGAAAVYAYAALQVNTKSMFPMRILAEEIIQGHLHAPIPATLTTTTSGLAEQVDLDSAGYPKSLTDLYAAMQKALNDSKALMSNAHVRLYHPLQYVAKYNAIARELQTKASTRYRDMLDAHWAVLSVPAEKPEDKKVAIAKRKGIANEIIAEYSKVIERLGQESQFAGTTIPLAAFLLNDTIQARAFVYASDVPESVAAVAPPAPVAVPNTFSEPLASPDLLASVRKEKGILLLRVQLEKRYMHLLPESFRALLDHQEMQRFQNTEALAKKFEQTYLGWRRIPSVMVAQHYQAGYEAAVAAARLGLYYTEDARSQALGHILIERSSKVYIPEQHQLDDLTSKAVAAAKEAAKLELDKRVAGLL